MTLSTSDTLTHEHAPLRPRAATAWRLIARLELAQLLGSRMVLLSLVGLLLAGVGTIVDGAARVGREHAAIRSMDAELQEQATYLRKLTAADDDLGLLLYYLSLPVAHAPNAWRSLSAGLSEMHPSARHLRLTGLVPQLYQAEIENPLSLLAGGFDFGFVLVFLLPLLVCVLSYDLVSRDAELGVDALVRAQSTPFSRLVGVRVLVRAALVYGVTALLVMFAVLWLKLGLDVRLALFTLAVSVYVTLWFLAALLIGSLRRSSAFNAIALVSGWTLASVLLPALLNLGILASSSEASGIELTLAQREAMNSGWDRPKEATMAPFRQLRPEFAAVTVPDDRFSWPWYYAMHEMADARVSSSVAAYQSALERRGEWTAWAALALPPLALQLLLDRAAETDLGTMLAYRRSIAGYHEALKRAFYPAIFAGQGLEAFELERLPRHRFEGRRRDAGLLDVAGLLAALVILAAALPRAVRRLDVPGARRAAEL